jgi:hypothetical protein
MRDVIRYVPNCLDPSLYKNKTKQNKTKNIDLLNAHLKPEQFIDRTIHCHIQHIFLLTNICDNVVHIHFLQTVQFNITRLSFLTFSSVPFTTQPTRARGDF